METSSISNISHEQSSYTKPSSEMLEALPPWAQTGREMQAIVDDPSVQQRVEPYWIKTISLLENLPDGPLYRVETADGRHIHVEVKYLPLPKGMLGPQPFEVTVLD